MPQASGSLDPSPEWQTPKLAWGLSPPALRASGILVTSLLLGPVNKVMGQCDG